MPVKERTIAERHKVASPNANDVFILLTCADFRRNPDGYWVAKKQLNIDGPGGVQRLIAAGHRFKRGQMSIFGLDLVTILETQCFVSAE